MFQVNDSSIRTSNSRRFFLIIGIILIGANLRAPITTIGPLLSEIQSSLHFSDAQAGLLNALPLMIFAVLSLVAPAVAAQFGLERVLGTALAAICCGIVVRSMGFAGALWLGTGLLSTGIAFENVLLPGLVKRDFPAQAGRIVAFYAVAMAATAGVATGAAVPLSMLFGSGDRGGNWQWATACWAVLPILSLICWLPQVRGRQHHLVATKNASTSLDQYASPWRHTIGWLVSLFFVLHSMVFYSIVGWFTSYAASAGISATRAGFFLLVYQVVAVATNLGCAPVIRRVRDQRLLGFSCGLLLLASTTGLAFLPRYSLIFLLVGGLGAGIAMVTSLSLFALRTFHYQQAAALSGMAQFVGYVGAAAGPLLVGVLRDVTGGWTAPMFMLMIASGFVTVFATLAGRAKFIE